MDGLGLHMSGLNHLGAAGMTGAMYAWPFFGMCDACGRRQRRADRGDQQRTGGQCASDRNACLRWLFICSVATSHDLLLPAKPGHSSAGIDRENIR